MSDKLEKLKVEARAFLEASGFMYRPTSGEPLLSDFLADFAQKVIDERLVIAVTALEKQIANCDLIIKRSGECSGVNCAGCEAARLKNGLSQALSQIHPQQGDNDAIESGLRKDSQSL